MSYKYQEIISCGTLTSLVALVLHKNAPVPGIEICVRHDLQNVGEAIAQTLDRLNLAPEDLTWIDPQYNREFQLDIAPIVSL